MTAALPPILDGVTRLLLDFDGPVCSIFANLSAADVADRARAELRNAGHDLKPAWCDESDPLALLRRIARERPTLAAEADSVVSALESEAARSARPNPDIVPLLEACAASGRSVVMVSNNATKAITDYVERQKIGNLVRSVVGRVPGDPASMKPSPQLLLAAMGSMPSRSCVFLGDAVRDVEAGAAAGVPTIGYANKPGKAEKLNSAGAVAVVESLTSITSVLIKRQAA